MAYLDNRLENLKECDNVRYWNGNEWAKAWYVSDDGICAIVAVGKRYPNAEKVMVPVDYVSAEVYSVNIEQG